MPDLADTLTRAMLALSSAGVPCILAGEPEPEPRPEQVIVLQPVSNTGLPSYGLNTSTKRLQVTCYASTLLEALGLEQQAGVALRAEGFRFIASRPAPDQDFIGHISEYRR